MGYKIDEIEGIGPSYREKLTAAGIMTTDDLLKYCCDPKGREDIAGRTGISRKLVLTWANRADLMRISGIGPQYAELLEAAGVDTVKELRNRNAANLAAKALEVNQQRKLAKTTPAETVVAGWIDAAKNMEPTIRH